MTDPDLKNAILRLTDILAKQQETLERLQN
uniref:Uncharacterized protein n=2 Tax=Culex pipiens complex TaxID=518105 RepID=A0A1S4KHW3_CULQU